MSAKEIGYQPAYFTFSIVGKGFLPSNPISLLVRLGDYRIKDDESFALGRCRGARGALSTRRKRKGKREGGERKKGEGKARCLRPVQLL